MATFNHLRYVICFIAWLSLLALYSHRANLSIAIIGMVQEKTKEKNESIKSTSSCPLRYNKTHSEIEEKTEKFIWGEAVQNYILMAYNAGYMLGHVPGAFLSIAYGSRAVMLFCITSSTILTFVSLFFAQYQWVFFGFRALIGLVNGPLYPMIHETIAAHSPPAERTFLTMFTHTGNLVSLAVVLPLGGYLIENYVNGWKYIFYMTGAFGILASIFWAIFVYSEPETNPLMSNCEKEHIVNSIYPNGKPPKKSLKNVPFFKIFTSRHIYLFTLAHFGKMMILYMNLFGIVKYLYKFFDLSSVNAGYLSVIPFGADFVFQLFYPKIVEMMKKRGFSISVIRRLNTFIGSLGSCAFLIALSFVKCTQLGVAIVLASLSLMFLAPMQAGYFTAIIEHAPQYAGITFSFINIGGTLSGVVQRYLTALMTQNFSDIRMAYKYSFIVTGVTSFVLSMFYVLFGTADLQPWAKTKQEDEHPQNVHENINVISDEEINTKI